MKIIQTPARFPPYTGGVEQYTYILSKKLVERGHEVTVICANEPEQAETRTTYEGIDVVRISDIGKIAQTNLTPRLPMELYREIQDADIVHTHLPTPWAADVSVAIANVSGVPSVVTYHNDIRGDGVSSYLANLYNATIMKATLSLTDQIITTQESYFEESNIPQRYENKVNTIRNGVDVERFRPIDVDVKAAVEFGFEPDSVNLFFLSVLDEYHDYKGLEILLEAIDKLPSDHHLVVGGDGAKKTYYEEFAREQGVTDQVTFAGYIPEENLAQYYNMADCFVLPSTSSQQEGFGLVLLEALACGTPVVTTDIVGVASEIKEGNLGIVVSNPTPITLSSAIESVANSRDNSFSRGAREFCVERYSWSGVTEDLEELYRSVSQNV